eukprot:1988390-Prymnesium_polylepis.1
MAIGHGHARHATSLHVVGGGPATSRSSARADGTSRHTDRPRSTRQSMPCLPRLTLKGAPAVRIRADAARAATNALFQRCGMDAAGADVCADVLVSNDLRGNESHGLSNMLRQYVGWFREGVHNPTPNGARNCRPAARATATAAPHIGRPRATQIPRPCASSRQCARCARRPPPPCSTPTTASASTSARWRWLSRCKRPRRSGWAASRCATRATWAGRATTRWWRRRRAASASASARPAATSPSPPLAPRRALGRTRSRGRRPRRPRLPS